MKKRVLITGCSSGIGLDVARALQNEYKVIATARKAEDVKRLRAEGLYALALDVTDSAQIRSVLQKVRSEFGELYALFNNAGYGQPGAVEDITKEALKEQFATNFFGMWDLTCEALKIFKEQGYGRIINHSSVLGLVSLKFRGAYNASKYAVEAMSDTLRLELRGSGIYVSTINTGPVRSAFRHNAIKKFHQNIDMQTTRYKQAYAKELLDHSQNNSPFTRSSDVVIKNIRHALSAKHPKARYYNTEATWVLATLKRLLPTSWMDTLLAKV